MKSSKNKGCVTGCITICLWLFALSVVLFLGYITIHLGVFALSVVLFFALSVFAFYGFSFGVLGTVLALTSPTYRKWLKSQRGFKSRLSKLPGMQSDSPATLAIVTALYTFPLSIFSWVAMQSVFSDIATTFIAAIMGFIGIAILFGWLIIGWGVSKSPKDSLEEDQEAQYFRRIERLDQIRELDPIAFERFVGTLFEQMGYQVETTAITGDEGVDLVLRKDSKLAIVQCKRYEGSVGQPIVRDLYGAMVHNRAEEAYLVTTGTITLPTQGWAKGKPIHLVDGNTLIKWLESFEVASEEKRETEEGPSSGEIAFATVINSLRKNMIAIGALVVAAILPICSCSTGLLAFHQSATTPTPTMALTIVATQPSTPLPVTPSPVEKFISTNTPISTPSIPTEPWTPALTNTPASVSTATPPLTVPPSPTAAPQPTLPPAASCVINAWVNDETPAQRQHVYVYGTLLCGEQPINGAPMHVVWHYKSTTETCDGVTDTSGSAVCERSIGGASKGYYVRLDLTITHDGQTYYATTGFTPR